MTKSDAYERLRRAAELLQDGGAQTEGAALLLSAWENLRGLRSDDFPPEVRPAFSFLQHEIARAGSEELSPREVTFLTDKLRQLAVMWTEPEDFSGR